MNGNPIDTQIRNQNEKPDNSEHFRFFVGKIAGLLLYLILN